MPEVAIVVVALLVAGAVVLAPLRHGSGDVPASDDPDAAEVRYRVALEALRDVETDRRAGALDDAAYAGQLADAEARAAAARAALDGGAPDDPRATRQVTGLRRAAPWVAAAIGVALVIGVAVPASGLANGTVENQALADAREAEAERQALIDRLVGDVADDPRDADALSELADAYLAGGTEEDLVRAAVSLRLLIELEPDRADAYERIITAYLRAGDYANARAALGAYAALEAADPIEIAFFEGLIALRGERDAGAAREAFDRFLELAPDDPRAGMVRGLRDEAGGPR